VDVRILAATNKDLEKATKEGRFREDLFYRLNVIPLHLPSLRKRIEDLPLLLEHFVYEFSRKRKREPFRFSPEAMDCLRRYKWPGNVRELENLIERVSILSSGDTITVSDLPEKIHQITILEIDNSADAPGESKHHGEEGKLPVHGIDLNSYVHNIERTLILSALEKAGGMRSKAAELLGLNRTTLIEKMKKMGIEMRRR
jgi:sigma-54 specific flagellar transcriptional regulator A